MRSLAEGKSVNEFNAEVANRYSWILESTSNIKEGGVLAQEEPILLWLVVWMRCGVSLPSFESKSSGARFWNVSFKLPIVYSKGDTERFRFNLCLASDSSMFLVVSLPLGSDRFPGFLSR